MNTQTRTEERKEYLRVSANESKMWDCLNEAHSDGLTDYEVEQKALEIYKNKGYSPLPWKNRKAVFANYFN